MTTITKLPRAGSKAREAIIADMTAKTYTGFAGAKRAWDFAQLAGGLYVNYIGDNQFALSAKKTKLSLREAPSRKTWNATEDQTPKPAAKKSAAPKATKPLDTKSLRKVPTANFTGVKKDETKGKTKVDVEVYPFPNEKLNSGDNDLWMVRSEITAPGGKTTDLPDLEVSSIRDVVRAYVRDVIKVDPVAGVWTLEIVTKKGALMAGPKKRIINIKVAVGERAIAKMPVKADTAARKSQKEATGKHDVDRAVQREIDRADKVIPYAVSERVIVRSVDGATTWPGYIVSFAKQGKLVQVKLDGKNKKKLVPLSLLSRPKKKPTFEMASMTDIADAIRKSPKAAKPAKPKVDVEARPLKKPRAKWVNLDDASDLLDQTGDLDSLIKMLKEAKRTGATRVRYEGQSFANIQVS